MTFKVGPKPVGLAAKKAAIKDNALAKSESVTIDFKALDPLAMPDRIGIVFDDSGSMFSRSTNTSDKSKIEDAKYGVQEFLRYCTPAATAVTVYPMNGIKIDLSADLMTIATKVFNFEPDGGTPLLSTLNNMLKTEKITRSIVFSDGYPDTWNMEREVTLAKELKIKVDTVYFGGNDEKAISFMKELAERTSGVFLHFDPAKVNFRSAFKYLTPGMYGMLSDKSVVTDIESGRRS